MPKITFLADTPISECNQELVNKLLKASSVDMIISVNSQGDMDSLKNSKKMVLSEYKKGACAEIRRRIAKA